MMLKSRAAGSRQSSNSVTLASPVGGWNARDSYTKMPTADAITLINIIPYPLYVETRKGHTIHETKVGGDTTHTPETLAVFCTTGGVQTLFSICNGVMQNITAAGDAPAAVVSGLSNDRWYSTNFSTAAGDYLYLANGADKPILYNGSTYVRVDGTSTPAITGVTTTLLTYPCVYAQRLWFVESSSKRIWYLPAGSVGGAAASIDLGNAFRKGGYIVALGNATLDAGEGSDDHLVVVSSEGEVAVYRGTDPSSSASWFRIGIYTVGRPVGDRPLERYNGDLLLLTEAGLGPISQLVLSSQVNERSNMLTDKIQWAISEAVTSAGSNYGWKVMIWPLGNLLILNVPYTASSEQFCMNTITGAWCRFKGWNAKSWALFNGMPVFGIATSGKVSKAFVGNTDDGSSIYAEALGAFSDYGNSAQFKLYHQARFTLIASGVNASNSFDFATETNFQITENFFTHTFPLTAASSSVFGTATFGSGAFSQSSTFFYDWVQLVGGGYNMAMHIRGYVRNPLQWNSYDVVYQQGGIM